MKVMANLKKKIPCHFRKKPIIALQNYVSLKSVNCHDFQGGNSEMLSRSFYTILNSVLRFSQSGCHPYLETQSTPIFNPQLRGRNRFMILPRAFIRKLTQLMRQEFELNADSLFSVYLQILYLRIVSILMRLE